MRQAGTEEREREGGRQGGKLWAEGKAHMRHESLLLADGGGGARSLLGAQSRAAVGHGERSSRLWVLGYSPERRAWRVS